MPSSPQIKTDIIEVVKKTSSATLTLNVQAKPYNITFTQSGLPAGTLWSVTFNGTTRSSTGSTITFENVTY